MAEKAQKKGLGTGLGALFGAGEADYDEGELLYVPISRVEPRMDQPRQTFDQAALEELAESLRQHGMIQPISARRLEGGYYQIIAGERRWRAARLAELAEVPVRVIEADDRRAAELALVENLQREDLNPVEEARGFKALMDEYGLTQEETARSVGKSRPTVANALRLLALAPEVLKMLEDGVLSTGHARALLSIPWPEIQVQTAKKVLAGGLSVRQTETLSGRIVRELRSAERAPADAPSGKPFVDYAAEVEKDLTRALGRRILLREGRKKGSITLEYYGADDRELLIEQLYRLGRTGE